ncbi:MAG: YwbE family protein [Deltaproteobacteria bacterium]|nr:YwbE family protein [Deltaproteobacteria bacterium]
MDGRKKADLKPGTRVQVVRKEDQRTGKLTAGIILEILTPSASHPHGIKVRLVNGVIGRVKMVMPELP